MWFVPIIWLVIGLFCILSEWFIPGFLIFFFGVGALITALCTAIIPGLDTQILYQLFIFGGSSVLTLFTLRKYLSKIFKGKYIGKEQESEYSGMKAEVIEEIKPDKPGHIRFQGTSWKAICYDEVLKKGENVEILKKEGLTFVVTRSILDEKTE
jgi:membrane protein implicated in regulation of membrane protease activity